MKILALLVKLTAKKGRKFNLFAMILHLERKFLCLRTLKVMLLKMVID